MSSETVLSWLQSAVDRRPGRGRLVTLAYHDVQNAELFERQLRHVRDRFSPVSLDEVAGALAGERVLPRDALLVTFDDGHWTVYERALPLLRRYRVPAVVFVIAGLIGTDDPFWFDEVRQLVRAGATSGATAGLSADDAVRRLKTVPDAERRRSVEELRASAGGKRVGSRQLTPAELRELEEGGVAIGNHTTTHPCLDRCGDEEIRDELMRAHAAIGGWLGRAPRAFAYPNGNGDDRAEAVLRELGYGAGFLFDHRVGRWPAENPLRISRVRVNSTTTMTRFRNIVSGLHPLVHHAIGRR